MAAVAVLLSLPLSLLCQQRGLVIFSERACNYSVMTNIMRRAASVADVDANVIYAPSGRRLFAACCHAASLPNYKFQLQRTFQWQTTNVKPIAGKSIAICEKSI